MDYNDLHTRGYSVAAAATDITTGACRVMGAVVDATAANCTLSLYDATATTGTADLILNVAATTGPSLVANFGPNGLAFATQLQAVVANGTAYVIYLDPND